MRALKTSMLFAITFGLSLLSSSALAGIETSGGSLKSESGGSASPTGGCKLIGNIFYRVSFSGGQNVIIPLDKAKQNSSCQQLRSYEAAETAYKDLYDKLGLSKVQLAMTDKQHGALQQIKQFGVKNCQCGSGGTEVVCIEKSYEGGTKKHFIDINCQ